MGSRAPILVGADKDNGLIPVMLTRDFENFNEGEIAGFDEETVEWILKHDGGIRLEKLQVQRDGFEYQCLDDKEPRSYPTGLFIAVELSEVEKLLKKGDVRSLRPQGKNPKKAGRPAGEKE